ncbi:MAG: CarD family transcriptional regulator [Oscillospiraceae bacterium]|nr:CarD family transcriptional regulator [Oscillospiraceae bacterium]
MCAKKIGKGDRVIYGTNGLCFIEDIKTMSLSHGSEERDYYVLRPEASPGSVFYVPCDNKALLSKMHFVMSKDETESLLSSARGKKMDWIDDKNERALCFREILASGEQEDLLMMIRCIFLRREELRANRKRLSGADEAALHTAEKMIREEFACSLDISSEEVGPYIREMLDYGEEEI